MARRGQTAASRDLGPIVVLAVAAGGALAGVMVDVAVTTAGWWQGDAWRWRHPVAVLLELASGERTWTGVATACLIGEVVILLGLASVVTFLIRRRARSTTTREWIRAASLMSGGGDTQRVRNDAEKAADQLSVQGADIGVLCGRSLPSRRQVFAPWGYQHLDIWGAGRRKVSARVVPAIVRSPGAVVCTAADAEIVVATRDARERLGSTWVFDPQELAAERPVWWWNPLRHVDSLAKADELADVLADAKLEDHQLDRVDPFLDPKARKLLALALYAAALAERPLSDVYRWLTDPRDETMAEILAGSTAGELVDAAFGALHRLPETTRNSVYQGAELYVDWLLDDQLAQWVTDSSSSRREFVPEEFVRSRGTLYALARKGKRTAAPLTTALIATTMRVAEELASSQHSGRLDPPLLAVLDEVSDSCRWRRLPDLYNRYGSCGVVLMTFLQSWSQGVQLWGNVGMKILWDSASCKIYGGGSNEIEFLRMVSETIGDWEMPTRAAFSSIEHFWSRVSWQDATRPKAIMTVGDLAALPDGMLVAMLAGARPMLLAAELEVPSTCDRAAVATSPRSDRAGHRQRRAASAREGDPSTGPQGTILDWLRGRES